MVRPDSAHLPVLMAYDYDKLYAETPDALGPPTPYLTAFLENLGLAGARLPLRPARPGGLTPGRADLLAARLVRAVLEFVAQCGQTGEGTGILVAHRVLAWFSKDSLAQLGVIRPRIKRQR